MTRQSDFPLTRNPETVRDNAVRSFTRAALCVGLAKLEKSNTNVVARRFADDRNVDLILRAAVSPASTTNTTALTQIAQAFLDALVPASAGADLLNRSIELNFAGAAQISVPGIALPTATWVAEGAPIPVVKAPTTPGVSLSPRKLATIAVLTGEMMRSSNAETMVRQVLLESLGPALDAALFSTTAGTAAQPAGLLNGITPLTPSTGGTGANKTDAMNDDLQAIAKALGPVAGNGNIVLAAAPAQAGALVTRLVRTPEWAIMMSSAIPDKTCIGIATAAVVSATDGVPAIEASSQTEIHFDTQPAEIVDVGGVRASPVGSIFQTDEVALKLRWPISWALRDARGVAWMNSVTW
jgi:hypothetical protein